MASCWLALLTRHFCYSQPFEKKISRVLAKSKSLVYAGTEKLVPAISSYVAILLLASANQNTQEPICRGHWSVRRAAACSKRFSMEMLVNHVDSVTTSRPGIYHDGEAAVDINALR